MRRRDEAAGSRPAPLDLRPGSRSTSSGSRPRIAVQAVIGFGRTRPMLASRSAASNGAPSAVPHSVQLNGEELFFSHVHLHGDPAPARRFLPDLIDRVWSGAIQPGKVFDLTLPLEHVWEGYRAMDERRAIKAVLRP
jgi:hypothetical protein